MRLAPPTANPRSATDYVLDLDTPLPLTFMYSCIYFHSDWRSMKINWQSYLNCLWYFRDKERIDFYDAKNLNEMVVRYEVGKCKPGSLCTSPSGMLLCEDVSQKSAEIKWLDCTNSFPDPQKVEWQVSGKLAGMEREMWPWGVTADECGHVFVCDKGNECVQLFSINGIYKGVLRIDHDDKTPKLIRWSEKT